MAKAQLQRGLTARRRTATSASEHYTFDILIDWDVIYEMAFQAAVNKSGKCVDGPIEIKITSRTLVGHGQ